MEFVSDGLCSDWIIYYEANVKKVCGVIGWLVGGWSSGRSLFAFVRSYTFVF